jgi:hypothetical protein
MAANVKASSQQQQQQQQQPVFKYMVQQLAVM